MKQYVVYNHKTRKDLLLLVVQSDLLSSLSTRLVAPLIKRTDFGVPVSRLNPVFTISHDAGDDVYVMDTANLAALSCERLGTRVDDLASEGIEILNAIDFLLCGF